MIVRKRSCRFLRRESYSRYQRCWVMDWSPGGGSARINSGMLLFHKKDTASKVIEINKNSRSFSPSPVHKPKQASSLFHGR